MRWLLVLLGLVVCVLFGVSTQMWLPLCRVHDTFMLGMALAVPGAAGGLLASLASSDGLRPPQYSGAPVRKLDLGFVGDILFGIGGGMLLYVVIPGEVPHDKPEAWLKLYGLALVLGFAGRGVMNGAADQQLKQLRRRTEDVERGQDQQKLDARAAALLTEYLEAKSQDSEAGRTELAAALVAASPEARLRLFRDAERVRESNWRDAALFARAAVGEPSRAVELLTRSQFTFQTLYDAGAGAKNHRILASIGYVSYDLYQPDQAITQLTKAIALAAEQLDPKHPFYHLCLATAYLDRHEKANKPITRADPELAAKVEPLLKIAREGEVYVEHLLAGLTAAEDGTSIKRYDRPLWTYLHSAPPVQAPRTAPPAGDGRA